MHREPREPPRRIPQDTRPGNPLGDIVRAGAGSIRVNAGGERSAIGEAELEVEIAGFFVERALDRRAEEVELAHAVLAAEREEFVPVGFDQRDHLALPGLMNDDRRNDLVGVYPRYHLQSQGPIQKRVSLAELPRRVSVVVDPRAPAA